MGTNKYTSELIHVRELFRKILHYLRTGMLVWPNNEDERQLLQAELDYYGLYWNRYFRDSTLLIPQYDSKLAEWTNASDSWYLLYRGSRDGFGKTDFFTAVKNASPTVIIAKTSAGWIFGWYQTETHPPQKAPAVDDSAFFFSLKNPRNEMYKEVPYVKSSLVSGGTTTQSFQFGCTHGRFGE